MRLLLEFARAHPRSSAIALVCMLIAGAAEAVGIASVAPLVAIYTSDGDATSAPNALVRMVDGLFDAVGIAPSANALLVLIFATFVFKAAVVLLARRQVGYTVAHVVTQLRLRLVRALLRSRWGYYVDQKVGTFANAFSIEATRASKGYQNATHVVMLAIQFAFYLGIAIAASWRISATLFAMGTLLVVVLRPLMTLGRKAGTRRTRLFRALLGRLTDLLQGVKPLKAMGREDLAAPLLEKGTLQVEKSLRLEVLSGEAIIALQEPIIIAMILGGFYVMTTVLDVEVTAMAVLGLVTMRSFDVLNRFQRRYHRVVVEESAYWSLLRTVEEAERQQERSHAGAEPTLDRSIDFDAVGFVYGDQKVFDALSLTIRAGEITALTGPSGAGKTTIVDLVAGLVDPSGGRVLIDGVSLRDIDLRSWRHRIGYVPQEMFLLHDTVAMNVSLGDPELDAADVEQALRDAHAWDFVAAMPEGVETIVGERGTRLSGGQRQRIAIARALVHRPWLLVLDEATAALDPASEDIVWEAMNELRGRTTILAISHQPSILEVADRAYSIRDGVAVEVRAESPTAAIAPAP